MSGSHLNETATESAWNANESRDAREQASGKLKTISSKDARRTVAQARANHA